MFDAALLRIFVPLAGGLWPNRSRMPSAKADRSPPIVILRHFMRTAGRAARLRIIDGVRQMRSAKRGVA